MKKKRDAPQVSDYAEYNARTERAKTERRRYQASATQGRMPRNERGAHRELSREIEDEGRISSTFARRLKSLMGGRS